MIVPIVTVCVTLLLGIAGVVANSRIQRKSNSIKVITQTRLDRRAHTQNRVAALLKLSDPFYIESLSTLEERRQAAREAAGIAADLRTKYCFYLKEDADLIGAVFEVKYILCKTMLEEIELDKKQLMAARRTLAQNVDVYTSTEWKRIKLETVGKETQGKKSIASWQSIYEYYNSHFLKDKNASLFGEEKVAER